MKITIIVLVFACSLQNVFSQNKSNFSLEINYGLNGNFFVRDYDELGGPVDKKYFLKKDFVGTTAGISLTYLFNKRNGISFEYDRSVNIGKKNYEGTINGTYVFINYFKLRHINNIFFVGYNHIFKLRKTDIHLECGPVMITSAQQEIAIESWDDVISLDERNYKHYGLSEGGVFLGFGFSKKIDTKFRMGLKSRIFYLVSTASLESITLTPTLTYNF